MRNPTAETMGEIVSWIHGDEHLAAVGTEEDEASVADFRRRSANAAWAGPHSLRSSRVGRHTIAASWPPSGF